VYGGIYSDDSLFCHTRVPSAIMTLKICSSSFIHSFIADLHKLTCTEFSDLQLKLHDVSHWIFQPLLLLLEWPVNDFLNNFSPGQSKFCFLQLLVRLLIAICFENVCTIHRLSYSKPHHKHIVWLFIAAYSNLKQNFKFFAPFMDSHNKTKNTLKQMIITVQHFIQAACNKLIYRLYLRLLGSPYVSEF
jgi:hypothetical protein